MDQKKKLFLLIQVNEAISLQVRLMDTLSEIEAATEKTYRNLDALVQQYAADATEYSGMSLKELEEFLELLEEE